MLFHDLIKKVLRTHQHTNLELLEHAYYFADESYKNIQQASGIPLIEHALYATLRLADFKVSEETLAACLLAFTLEIGISKETVRQSFGDEITFLIESVSKIGQLRTNTNEQDTSNLRKMFLAASQDVRVLFIKLCDKLHNMQTLDFLPDPAKRKFLAQEVLDIYAPLAYRLGLGQLKAELEDLAFKQVNPEEYKTIEQALHASKKEREYILYEMRKTIKRSLAQEGLQADIQARVKHIYSIYHKIIDRHYKLEDMRDLIALRILVQTVDDCYKALRIVHSLWKPIPEGFKDYIANPKQNGYQSLHTAVIGIKEKPIEFQIRTFAMHDISEEGVAVHWGYKGVQHGGEIDTKLQWLKQLIALKSLNDQEFIEHIKVDLFSDKIYVFTPKGNVVELPKTATPLDFAYAIHSDVGDHCIGASINGKYSPLKTEVQNGDTIDIITAKNQHPTMDWLKIVRTYKARSKIKQYLRRNGVTPASSTAPSKAVEEKKTIEESMIDVSGMRNIEITLARCCTPLPGDKIFGLRTKEHNVMIHRLDCSNIPKQREHLKEIKVHWKEYYVSTLELILEAQDRVGLFAEVLNVVASQHINVENAKGKILSKGHAEIRFHVQIKDNATLLRLIQILKKIKDVQKVYLGEIRNT
ncbi:bifunctional (p)ppGpp synthetase/guanosine-3',5'-bis(diphosphate) 3'-pyrophosphohydrolase [Candidatus Woesearchaeota archaeon]|nr:bifunctional (p)ppGpp synthetase/guanosine-3',5'-bis(diphosphate) 3'-pyrophosphohydrolase [Candidatus Woesearchaeota archaeon]